MQSTLYSFPGLAPVALAVTMLRARLDATRHREGGYTTETVIVTGLLAAAAIIVIAIIVGKITNQASSLKTQ